MKNHIHWQNQVKFQLLMDIEFGTPSSGCKNLGICNMSPVKNDFFISNSINQKSKALVSFYNFDHIRIDFFKKSMTDKTQKKFFGQNFFSIQESFEYQGDWNEGNVFNFLLEKGEYAIKDYDSLFQVYFKPID